MAPLSSNEILFLKDSQTSVVLNIKQMKTEKLSIAAENEDYYKGNFSNQCKLSYDGELLIVYRKLRENWVLQQVRCTRAQNEPDNL